MDVTVDMMESEGITAEIHSPGAPQVIAFQGGDKLINMPRAAYASQLGFRSGSGHTADNTTAFKRFLRNKNIYTLVLDADYIIATTQTEPAHDIVIIGNGHRLIIDDVSGGYGLIKANNYGLFFENVVFTVGSAFATMNDDKKNYKANVVYAANGYTQTLGEIRFDGCSFIAANGFNPGAVWANPSPDPEFTLDTVNHGFSAVRLTGCSIVNNTNIIVTIYDMPGTVEVTGCNIKNMRARIVTVGVRSPNDSNFVARALELGLAAETIKAFNQSIRRQISLYVHDNRVKNDIIISDISAQYICFVWMKGGKAVATGNRIEDIAVSLTRNALNKPTEVFPMYLLAEDVVFSGNVCKNIYNFAYDPTAATGSEDKLYYTHSILPNVKMYEGDKIVENNTFILEESFLAERCQTLGKSIDDLWPIVFVELYADGDNVNINNNLIDSYFLQLTRMDRKRRDGIVRLTDNSFRVGHLGRADGTVNFKNDLFSTYTGTYIISGNTLKIGCVETALNLINGNAPPSSYTGELSTRAIIRDNAFEFGTVRDAVRLANNPRAQGDITIMNNMIRADDCRQAFTFVYGNEARTRISGNRIDAAYNASAQLSGLIQEGATSLSPDLSADFSADNSLDQSCANIVIGARRVTFSAKFPASAFSANLIQLFIQSRTTEFPAGKAYTYYLRLSALDQGIHDEIIKLVFSPHGDSSYKLRYRTASGYSEKTADELYTESVNEPLYSEGGEAVPLRVVGSANSNVKIKQVTDEVAADWYDISIVTVVKTVVKGVPPLTFTANGQPLVDWTIYGNTVNGENVGDLITEGEHAGEYSVPVTVTNGTDTETTNLYLPEQIKMVGDEAEYIDYAEQKQHRVRKNLLPNTATSQTINGVTFTVNDDGSITCNGTASAITYFNLNENFNSTLYAGMKASFFQSGQQSSINTFVIRISKADRVSIQDLTMNDQVIIDSGDSLLLAIRINSGYTCNSLTFYPMICKADIEDDTYEPYIENTDIDVTLPALSTIKGTNTLSVGTEVQPSNMEIIYAPKEPELKLMMKKKLR